MKPPPKRRPPLRAAEVKQQLDFGLTRARVQHANLAAEIEALRLRVEELEEELEGIPRPELPADLIRKPPADHLRVIDDD